MILKGTTTHSKNKRQMLPKNFILLEAKLMAHKRLMDIYSRFLSQIKIIKNVLLKHLLIDDTVFKYQMRSNKIQLILFKILFKFYWIS